MSEETSLNDELEKARSTTPKVSMETIGDTGLRQHGGYIAEEFLPALKGTRGAQTYREMSDNDPTVGAVIFAITTLIRQCEWSVQAAGDSPEAEAGKEFVEQVMDDMEQPWSAMIAEACTMFIYGYAPMELIWKRRLGPEKGRKQGFSQYEDGRVGLRKVSLRAQPTIVRWDFDEEDGDPIAMHQQPHTGTEVTIPFEKLLLFRTTENRNNPEGRSILRTAYRPWFFKKKLEEIEAVGVERDLAGLPVAYVPAQYFDPNAPPEDKALLAAWQRLVTSVRRDKKEGLVLPSTRDANNNLLFDFKLLSTAGSRTFDTTKVLDRYDRAIATSVLADFIFLGQQAVGSFALSSDKTALFAASVGAFTKSMADVVNRDLIPRLWRYNGFNRDHMPQVQCGDVESQNLGEIAAYLTALVGAGAQLFPDRELENHLRRAGGLPMAPEEGDDEGGGAMQEAVEREMARQAAAREAKRTAASEGDEGNPDDTPPNKDPEED